jgi:hypothetical protein
MFLLLLLYTLIISLVVCTIFAFVFNKPVGRILERIFKEEIYIIWQKYIIFSIFVVGVSSGVKIWKLEEYLNPDQAVNKLASLNTDRIVLEIYRVIIDTSVSITWLIFTFLIFSLIAWVILKAFESRKNLNP